MLIIIVTDALDLALYDYTRLHISVYLTPLEGYWTELELPPPAELALPPSTSCSLLVLDGFLFDMSFSGN